MFRHIYYFARIVDIIDMGYCMGMVESMLLVIDLFIYCYIYIYFWDYMFF
jgi:hypothetical protein